jgi:hypothetical protein
MIINAAPLEIAVAKTSNFTTRTNHRNHGRCT